MRKLLAFLSLLLFAAPSFAATCQTFFTLEDGRLLSSASGPEYRPGDFVHFDTYNRSGGGLDVQITGAPTHAWDGATCATIFPGRAVPHPTMPKGLARWFE